MQYPIIDNFNIFNDTGYESSEFINLNSDNAGYIDTGIQLTTQTFKIEISFVLHSYLSGEQPLISTWTNTYNYWNLFIHNNGRFDFYNGAHNYLNEISLNTLHTIIIEGTANEYIIKYDNNDIYHIIRNRFDNPTSLKLFIRGDLQSRSLNYSVKQVNISVNNIQIFNLIPATDTIINGMYNTIDNEFYEIQNSIINDTIFKIKKFTYDNIEHLLKLPLPHYFPHPVIDSLKRASEGTMTNKDREILTHYLSPLGIGGI